MNKGQRLHNCGNNMQLKKVNDHQDGLTWRCRKVHSIQTEKGQYKVKDVKLSIHHDTWLNDSNFSLEVITEHDIEHELKLSHQIVIEWSAYLRDVCNYTEIQESEQIGGEGVHVDESKFGKR